MYRLGKQPLEKGGRSSSDSGDFYKNQHDNLPKAIVAISSASDYSKGYRHGDQELSASLEEAQIGSGDSDGFSGDSGENRLIPTSANACVKIPYPSPDSKRRRRRSPKLPKGANRLSQYSTCHSCRRPEKLCVLCSVCPTPYCERCLFVRHGEDIYEVCKAEINWLCPKCRPGCGRGCERICCNCSLCCNKHKNLPPVGRGEGRRLIKEATSAGWNLHDYQIHLKTNESKLKIANRKLLSWGCTKATDNRMKVIGKGPEHLTTKQKSLVQKRITATGETSARMSDHRRIRARVGKRINENDAWRDPSTKPAGNDMVGTSYEDLCESLAAYSDMAPNLYIMRLWFDREKELTGNQLSITLTDKEIQIKNSIRKRSLAGQIAEEFNPAKLKSLPSNKQKSMKQKLNHDLGVELTGYINKRLQQFYEEVDRQMTIDFVRARTDIELTIQRMKGVVESTENAISGHKLKEEYHEEYDEDYSE